MWTTRDRILTEAVMARWGLARDTAAAAVRLTRIARGQSGPIRITSGYRTPEQQQAILEQVAPGEAKSPADSAHSRAFPATAVDFSGPLARLQRLEQSLAAEEAGFTTGHVHRGTGWHLHCETS